MRVIGNLIVPLVGLVFLGLGLWWGWDAWTFVQRAQPAQAKVERFEERTKKKRVSGTTRTRTYYAPVFTFQDAKGASHTVTSDTGSGKPAYEVGQPIRVLYDPADPQQARIDAFSELWLFPVAFSGIGVLCVGFAGWFTRRR